MGLNHSDRRRFVDAYSNLVLSSWGDEAYAARLRTNPLAAAQEAGMVIPAGVSVTIVRHPADEVGPGAAANADVDAQVALYEEGLRSGEVVLHLPETPVLDTSELGMDELSSVAAGATYCCCCCPSCSSCTV